MKYLSLPWFKGFASRTIWLWAVSFASFTACQQPMDTVDKDITPIHAPFPMPSFQRPVFKADTFSIEDYGALPGGAVKNTTALRKAIEACARGGGGVVLVPKGKWLTGPIHLMSHVNLHIAKDAELIFSSDYTDYLPLVFSRWEGTELYNFSSLVYAHDQQNIAITGKGKLDGQGASWARKYQRMNWRDPQSAVQRLRAMGEQKVPVEERRFGVMTDDILYPSFIHLIHCKNILLEGFVINKGPYWTIHPTYSEDVIIRDLRVETYGQANGDGINPDACKNVLVENCILNTGDDAITLKSGRDREGRLRGRGTENVVIRHCRAEKGHGGIALGSEMSGGIRNVYVYDCEFASPLWGINIKTMRGRGGVVENIWFENIVMDSIQRTALQLTMYYHDTPPEPLSERTPVYRNIHFKDIQCKYAPVGIRLAGLPELPIHNTTYQNITLNAKKGIVCSYADTLTFEYLQMTVSGYPVGTFENSRQVMVSHLNAPLPHDTIFLVTGAQKENYTFKNIPDTSKIFFNENSH